jgi:hypothetical protein
MSAGDEKWAKQMSPTELDFTPPTRQQDKIQFPLGSY